MSGFDGLRMLKNWQRYSKKIPKLHFAFIKGYNDTEGEIRHLAQIVKDLDLRVDFNVVRYNPQSSEYSETDESDIYTLSHIFREVLPETKVKIVPRVGFDVKASCGMFVN
jgi:adenine C2-methylase RlmN of 23S rRNA A2503 and tRNA A37